MKTLKQRYEEYIALVKANGGKTLTFTAPCCSLEVEDVAASEGETWTTLSTCPHCSAMYFKTITDSEIIATAPPKTR